MNVRKIRVEWTGPFSVDQVIAENNDEGEPPHFDGEDHGLYQIYGRHILFGPNALLYVGQAVEQTFSARFEQHKKEWLHNEEDIQVFLGAIYDPERHSPRDKWKAWRVDITIAEKILIYKYSPNYNSTNISDPPKLPAKNIRLIHTGERNKLEPNDNAPEDYG